MPIFWHQMSKATQDIARDHAVLNKIHILDQNAI